MRFFRLRTALAASLASALLLAPAAHAADAAKKSAKENNRYVARDVETLYNAAKNQLDKRRYKIAAMLFDEVERQHPYSVWARRAELMSAFSHYLAQDYTESIDSANRFLSIHPGNKDAPYAMYLIGVDYYEQIGDVNRDQKTAQQALDAMGDLIRRYPEHDLCRRCEAEGRSDQRPSRRPRDGYRPLLSAPPRMARLDLSLPQGGRYLSDDQPCAGSLAAPHRILS